MPFTTRHDVRRRSSPLVVALALVLLIALSGGAAGSTTPQPVEPVGVWPLQPTPDVVARFDPPASPYGPGHRGVDLLGGAGQPVHTALAGQVTYAGLLAGRGVVVVDHGDTRTTYEPVSAAVAVGDRVRQGGMIGVLELPSSHCFPRACLHWGWLRGEVYLDPLRLVGRGPVRLLPLWGGPPAGSAPHTSGPLRYQ